MTTPRRSRVEALMISEGDLVTHTVAPPRRRARIRTTMWLDALVAAAALAAAIPLFDALSDPPRAAFVIRNDTVWDLTVYVETGPRSVMPVATIGAERTRELTEVLVPGERWTFSWRFTGDEVGRSSISHDELTDPDFVLTVPDDVSHTLRTSGAQPAP